MAAGSPVGLGGLVFDPEAIAALPVGEREAVAQQLAAVEAAYKANPLLGYRPHPKQVPFHSPDADGGWPPLRAFFGGNRSGKTTAAVVDTLIQLTPLEMLPGSPQGVQAVAWPVQVPDRDARFDVHDGWGCA